MLNAEDLDSFSLQKGKCPKAGEIVRDTISKFRYMLHAMSLQKVGIS